jgi:GTP1/Obg family GTP-binding protein
MPGEYAEGLPQTNLPFDKLEMLRRQPSVIQRVESQIKEAEINLENLKKVHQLLTEHPEIHELLTLMRKVAI